MSGRARRRAIKRRRTRAYDPRLLPPGPGLTRHGCRRRPAREMPGCAVPRRHRYVLAERRGRPDQHGSSTLASSPLRCNFTLLDHLEGEGAATPPARRRPAQRTSAQRLRGQELARAVSGRHSPTRHQDTEERGQGAEPLLVNHGSGGGRQGGQVRGSRWRTPTLAPGWSRIVRLSPEFPESVVTASWRRRAANSGGHRSS